MVFQLSGEFQPNGAKLTETQGAREIQGNPGRKEAYGSVILPRMIEVDLNRNLVELELQVESITQGSWYLILMKPDGTYTKLEPGTPKTA